MFNEILTGAKSLENPPKPAPDPYRVPAEIPEMTACASCRELFPSKQSMMGMCRRCAPTATETLNSLGSTERVSYESGEQQERDRKMKNTLFSIVLFIVVAVGLAAFKFGMREQYREDMNQAAGHKPVYYTPSE
ncbi:MAG: hypothetical protein H0V17_17750 [Deltaproteobacteria bacterium]|nr:hypothetical protein [Deltaproteobacteria bacterium]